MNPLKRGIFASVVSLMFIILSVKQNAQAQSSTQVLYQGVSHTIRIYQDNDRLIMHTYCSKDQVVCLPTEA